MFNREGLATEKVSGLLGMNMGKRKRQFTRVAESRESLQVVIW